MNSEQESITVQTPQAQPPLSEPVVESTPKPRRFRKILFVVATIMALASLAVGALWYLRQRTGNKASTSTYSDTEVQDVDVSSVIPVAKSFSVTTDRVVVNGELQAGQSLTILPSDRPATAVTGQLYLDKTTNQLLYYNGTTYVALGGSITIFQGNTLAGVTSVQGQTGAVNFVGVNGVQVSGTTISVDGTVCLITNNCGFANISAFVNSGNSFGATATLGTNDNFDLNLETGGTTRLTVEADGDVVANVRVLTPELNNISAGTLSVGTASTATTIQLGAPSTAGLNQSINIGTNSGAGSTTNIVVGSATPASITTIDGGGGIQIGTGITPLVGIRTQSNSATTFQIQDANGIQIVGAGTLPNASLINGGNFELPSDISGWSSKNGASLSHNTANFYFGAGSMAITTSGSADQGAQYSYAFTNGTTYTFEFFGKLASGTFSDLRIGHVDSGVDVDCPKSPFIPTAFDFSLFSNAWVLISCTFTASNTSALYVKQSGAASRTFYIDNLTMGLESTNRQISASGTFRLNGRVTTPLIIQPGENSTSALRVATATGGNFLNVDTHNEQLTIFSTKSEAINAFSAVGFGVAGSTASNSTYGVVGSALFGLGGGVYGAGQQLPGVFGQANDAISGLFQTSNTSGTNANATLVVRANSAQTADLFQVQNTASTALLRVGVTGTLTLTNTTNNTVRIANAGGSDLITFSTNTFSIVANGTLTNNGAATFQTPTNSTTAFQVQDSATATILNVDTVNRRVGVGRNNPGATLDIDSGTSSSNIDILRVITDVGGPDDVKFKVDSDGDVNFDGNLNVGSTAFVARTFQLGTQTVTLTDDGVANDTATITSSVLIMVVDETANAGVPDLVLSELTVLNLGTPLFIWNAESDGTHDTFTITDSAGVVELPGGATVTLGPWDTLSLMYTGDRWVTLAQADN